MTIQEQYIDSYRQTQETWAGVVENFSKDLQRSFEQPFKPFAPVDPNETIDQIFDFWEKSLEVQRDAFGSSAPLKDLQDKFGFTPEAVLQAARNQLAHGAQPGAKRHNPSHLLAPRRSVDFVVLRGPSPGDPLRSGS